MLSAVESHFGPGRAYSHHFAGPAVPSLLPHCPISTLPVLSSTAAAMSAAEFARPHPKPRYSNGPIRNGLASPRSKYSEQTGPVNLAVSQQQTSTTLSLADTSISVPQSQSNIEPVSPSISNLYGPPKLPYCPPQVTCAHVYPSLNYPSLYPKTHPTTNVISSSDPVQTSSPSSYVRQQPCKASSAGDCTSTITSNDKASGFKVPSGKEGSLKHRILTRPYADREVKSKPSIHGTIVRSTNNNNPSTNFTKGSLIELANGDLRPVEDMRTEDFILSSNKNPELQMADTMVVKIAPGMQNNVLITFSYNGNTILLVGLLTTLALVSSTAALPDKTEDDSKSPSVVSRLDPVLRKALLQALSNLERNTSEDENDDSESSTATTIVDEILEESTTSDQTSAVQYHSYVVDANNETGTTTDDTEIIQTIIVKAPRPTVSSSLDVDEVSEQNDNDVIIRFDKLDPVKESDIRVETVQVAQSVSPSDKTNEINGDTDDDSVNEKLTTKQLKKVTTYKPTTTTTTTTTTEAPTHNEDGENIEHVKENDVKIYQAPLVTAFTIQQDGNGLPKNVIPLYKQDVVPASMSLPVEQFSFSSHSSNQNFQNVQSNRNTHPAPTFSIQTSHQPQPPVFNGNTYAFLEQKQKQLEQQIVYLQDQQRKQEELFRQQQSYQDQQALQRQAQLLLEQRLRIEEDYRLRQQKYEQELKAYKEKQQVQLQSRFNQPSVVVEGQTTLNTQVDALKEAPVDQAQITQQPQPQVQPQQQLPAQQPPPVQQQVPAQQPIPAQQQFPEHQHLPVQQPPPPFAPELSQQNVQVQHHTVTEIQNQQHLQVQPLQHREQDIELKRQIERQNEECRIKTLKYEEDLKNYRQKIQAQQYAEQQSQQQQLFSRQQLPFLPAQQFAPSQQIFSQGLPQQQQQVRFNNNQPQFRTNVQIVPSVQFQSFQVPTQQMLPIREAQSFRSRSQSEFHQQQTNIPQLSAVQELPQRSFQQFHTSGPVIQNSNIDPVIAAPPDAIQRNRVFRQESDTANFFNNNNRISINPVNNNADNYLQSLLFQSGISGRQNEDLNIITKVLALNHGIQQSPNDQQQIRFPRRENV